MRSLLGIAVMVLASTVSAGDEKFYPILGADGRVQVIKTPTDTDGSAKPKVATKAEPDRSLAQKIEPTAEATKADFRAEVTDDSEEYVDSEALEKQQQSESSEKSRFYIVNDELGSHIDEGDGANDGPEESVRAVTSTESGPEDFRTVDEGLTVVATEDALAGLPGLPRCLDQEAISAAGDLAQNESEMLVIDKRTYSFLKAPGIAATYHLGGEGLRSIVASSFSKTDRKPSFLHPFLAFFDTQGCLIRVVGNFYESFYRATEKRHPMLKAGLTVHAEEAFMLVLMPGSDEIESVASLPYKYSRVGQLKFKLKKQ